jgi:hypothetical protein
MVAGPVYTNSNSWMAMAIETTVGTAAALPIYWIPVKTPKITPMITEVDDDSLRGSMVKVYNQIPTVRHDEYSFTCLAYIDTLPALFRSLLGSPDGIIPTGTTTPTGTLAAASLAGATSVSSSVSIPTGTAIKIDTGVNVEYVTTNAAPTGAGPYAIGVPALQFAHASGAAITATTGPFQHTLSLLNNAPASANQPPSYTIFDYDGYQVRQLTAAQVDDVAVKFIATGLVEVTVKAMANPFTIRGGAAPNTAFSNIQATPAWACTPTLNSAASTTIVDGEISLKRGTKPVHTLGTQAPYKFQVGPLDISGKLTVINSNDTELNWYLNDSIIPVNLLWTPPQTTADTFAFDMATCKVKVASQDRGGDELIVTALDLQPLPNATDATAGGVSPIKGTFITNQPTSY